MYVLQCVIQQNTPIKIYPLRYITSNIEFKVTWITVNDNKCDIIDIERIAKVDS